MPVAGSAVLLVVLAAAADESLGVAAATSTTGAAQGELTAVGLGPELASLLSELGELPLTSEELALVEALGADTATSAASASARPARAEAWASPGSLDRAAREVQSGRLVETVARTAEEALLELPVLFGTYRFGARSPLVMDGVLLGRDSDPPGAGWLGTDPRMLQGLLLSSAGALDAGARSDVGAILLAGRAAPRGAAGVAVVTADARSADRSTGAFGEVGLGIDVAALRLSVRYDDYQAMRALTSTRTIALESAAQRWSAGARVRILGRSEDPITVTLGGNLHRAQAVPLLTSAGARLASLRPAQRHLAFVRLDAESDPLDGFLLAAYHGFARTLAAGASSLDESAHHAQGRAAIGYRVAPSLSVRAGADGEVGSTSLLGGDVEGDERRVDGFLESRLDLGAVEASATARLAHRGLSLRQASVQRSSSDNVLAGAVRGHLTIAGPFGVGASIARGIGPAKVEEQADRAGEDLLPMSRSTTVELGPRVRTDRIWMDLVGFYSWIDGSLERVAQGIVSTDVRVLGAELQGRWWIRDELALLAAAGWADGVEAESDLNAASVAVLSGVVSLRYLFRASDFVEVHARAATAPFRVLSERPSDGFLFVLGPEPEAYVRVGLTAGIDLGAGFRLGLAVENAADQALRLHPSPVPAAGIDLRASLTWATE